MRRRRHVVVVHGAGQIRRRNVGHQGQCGRIQLTDRNLVARKRLTGSGIDQRDTASGKIAAPHGLRRNGRILIEHVVGTIARVIELEVRPAILVRVQPGDLHGPTEGRAETVLAERRLRDRHIRAQLIRCGVERRAAIRIRGRSLIRVLPARAASAEHKSTAPAWTDAAPAADLIRAAGTADLTRPAEAASAARKLAAAGSKARGELPGRRVELSESDRLEAVVQRSAVEARRVTAAADGHRVCLRALK
jgi:hypothetical protein